MMIDSRQAFSNAAVAAAAVARARRAHLNVHKPPCQYGEHAHWNNDWDGLASNFPINTREMGPGERRDILDDVMDPRRRCASPHPLVPNWPISSPSLRRNSPE
jgi:hypothetical protein